MSGVLENVMESSLILIDDLNNAKDEEAQDKIINEFLKRNTDIHVGEFKSGVEWFNVINPLSLEKDLRGKLVILDFFTYCCINCLHILPKMKEIEEEHSIESGVVVVGVHSAKFDNEKDSSNIISALLRYGITHPVVNDADGSMWTALGIPCWPTLLVLSPTGNPIFVAVGESNMPELELIVRKAASFYRYSGELSDHKLPVKSLAHIESQGPLLFPGKVACCPTTSGYILAVADTGHHRILVSLPSGEVQYVIGGETPGCVDGNISTAKFHSPQGLAFVDSDTLYVADTENNAIRKIDLVTQKVSTVFSNQKRSTESASALCSPWDICSLPDGSCLLIAVAGSHQLWALFLRDILWWRNAQMTAGMCVAVAGTGREENRNNVYPHAAAFAQPSGICVAPTLNALFVADSESSSVRRIDLKDGRVSAVVGGGRSPTDLFCFGDVDGRQWDVRLQHPLGVAWSPARGGALYVADSYNHKIKVVMPEERSCRTLLGSGVPGDSLKPGAEQLNEPGGLCASPCGSLLYVADTNNNCIKIIQLTPLEDPLSSVSKLDLKLSSSLSGSQEPVIDGEVSIKINASGGTVSWLVDLMLSNGLTYTAGAPQRWSLQIPKLPGWVGEPCKGELISGNLRLVINVPPNNSLSTHKILFIASMFTCDNSSTCQRQNVCLALNIEYANGASIQTECCLTHSVGQKKKYNCNKLS